MVGAVFKWKNDPPSEGSPYSVEGKVINTPNCEFKLEKKQLVGDVTYPATVADQDVVKERRIQAFVAGNRKVSRSDGRIDHSSGLGSVTIEWTVYDVDNKPVGTSQSTHTIYVTWDEPATNLRQETLFNLACEMANGMSVDAADQGKAVFEKVWSEFSDRVVKRMDGTAMKYWGDPAQLNYSAENLLKFGDGSCSAWAEFLGECAKIQKLNKQSMVAFRSAAALHPFTVQGVNYYGVCGMAEMPANFSGSIRMNGIPGQSNQTPVDFFFSHQIVGWNTDFPQEPTLTATEIEPQLNEINQKFNVLQIDAQAELYDPSYGIKATSLRAYEHLVMKRREYNLLTMFGVPNGQALSINEGQAQQDAIFSNDRS
jgi:hypothetical protein